MSQKKYVSLSKLSTFLDNLKNIFASKTEFDEVKNAKADIDHIQEVSKGGTGLTSVTEGNFIVGNSEESMIEMTPDEVLSYINGASVMTLSTEEYETLETSGTTNANTLYMLTDAEEEGYYTETEIDTKISEINTSIDNSKNEVKLYSDNNLNVSKEYTDNAVSQKTQVQMITSDVTAILPTFKIHKISQEEYEQELANGTLEDNALYLTPDEEVDLSGYATIEQLNEKSNTEHNHDDMYYTEVEIDSLLNGKSDITHNHDNAYDTKGSADGALIEAKSYADTTANNAANAVKNDLLNGAGDAYDTLKELGDLIDENTDAIDALKIVATGKADISHTHNDIYYTESEIDGKVSAINTSVSNSLNEAKSYSDTNLGIAKTYADNIVAQKSQIQIITWEADD